MAEETVTPENSDENEALREEGIRALKAERESNKDLRRQLKELADWKEAQENAGKSDIEKLSAEVTKYKADMEKASRESMRLRVAMEKGLTAKQAARLVGDDEDALRADADDLLSTFRPAVEPENDTPEVELDSRPKEKLKGGARPSDEAVELNPEKLAAEIAAITQ